MKESPFIYGSTVSAGAFTNREKEIKKLHENLTQGINTIIISPRRWGKSSLVEKVIQDINRQEKRLKTVVIDLFSISNEEEFLEAYAKDVIKASSSQWQSWIQVCKDFFNQLTPKINIGVDPGSEFSISFDWDEIRKFKDEILNLPEAIGQKKKIKFIICLDEFQNLAEYPNYGHLEKKLRAHWQRHKQVTYCLYGSKHHMMTDVFNNPSKPFYRFGDILLLKKIPAEKWTSVITERFQSTGKSISTEDARIIPYLMKNHSWYVQQLAHYTWQKTDIKAGGSEIESALNELIYTNTPLYQNEVESLSTTQLNLLKAIVRKEAQLSSSAVMNKYKLGTSGNVNKSKNKLTKEGLIHKIGGQYEMVDPAFELWFLKQYFNQDISKLDPGHS